MLSNAQTYPAGSIILKVVPGVVGEDANNSGNGTLITQIKRIIADL